MTSPTVAIGSGPVRILSDLHLGHRLSRIARTEQLRPLIAGAATVVFNGDTWQELAAPFRVRSQEMLAELRDICATEGAHAVFLPGNHDPGWDHPGFLELAGGRIVITHGDTFYPEGSPWKREVLARPDLLRRIWQDHPDAAHDPAVRMIVARRISRELGSLEHPTGKSIVMRAIDAAFPPQRALRMLACWLGRFDAARRFCDSWFPKAEAIVFGHFHFQGNATRGHRLAIDTGSFVNPGAAAIIEWKNHLLQLHQIDESRTAFRHGHALGLWRIG
jgi:exonuclease SbcD